MHWNDDRYIAFDYETSGTKPEYALQPWRMARGDAWATSLVWIRKDPTGFVVKGGLKPDVAMMREMLTDAIERKATLVGWNTVFDISWLLAYGCEDLVMKVRWLDGMLLWKHHAVEPEYEIVTHKKKPFDLKSCVAEVLPAFAGYEEGVDFHDTSDEARAALHAYNERDVALTLRLAKRWFGKLTPKQQTNALIEAQCLPLIAKANLKGMVIDTLAARELEAYLTGVADRQLAILAPYGVTERTVRSPIQMGKLLFEQWGLPVIKHNKSKKTGKETKSTDKETLYELSFQDPRAHELRLYREALNNRTKFATALLASVKYNGSGLTHPQCRVFSTYSGRMAYSSTQKARGIGPTGRERKEERQTGFALHQEKRDAIFRSVVVAPPGYTIVEFDAAGQEFRWMAIASKDETMLALCGVGEDPHMFMGSRIAERDYREMQAALEKGDKLVKEKRQLGKVANLCVAEGTLLLTDRGPCRIEDVRRDDLVWDGVEFVRHAGVVCSGVKQVISYAGITATPTHEVLVNDKWETLEDAARHGWRIEPALGAGRAHRYRSAVRLVDSIVRRAAREKRRALRDGALRLWARARGQLAVHGDRALRAVQGLRDTPTACEAGALRGYDSGASACAEARQRMVPAVQQPEGSLIQELWRAWHRVPLRFRSGGGRLGVGASTASDLSGAGPRPDQQRWSLRTWQRALGYAQGEPCQPTTVRVYDVQDCGPRHRFAANGLIVHNSLQYRTSAKKLRSVARVQYGLPMELPQAEQVHFIYQKTYQGVPLYWEKQIAQTKRLGYVETLGGRRVQVIGNWGGRMGWSMGSTAINYRIQGTGADQKYLALAVIKSYLNKIGAYFGWDLHDGIYLLVPDAQVEHATVEIRRLLDNLPYERAWGFAPPIPMPWDCKIGSSWGALKEVRA
jgi:DNA polymerase I-like protein with 3'-5' exonuclease and polymerase domains